MCDVCDILQSSFQPAHVMTSTLCDYGNGNMGSGIRRLAGEMLTIGGQKSYPIGYDNGFSDGFFLGEKKGFIKGTIISTAVIGTCSLAVWGIRKAYDHRKLKKQQKQEVL